eukprot:7970950-Ditylum_brightwellii.AAC.1
MHVIPPDNDNTMDLPPIPCAYPTCYSPETVNFLAQQTCTPHLCNVVLHPTTGKPMNYQQLIKDPATTATWSTGMCQELGCLAQGWKKKKKEPTP